MKNNFISELKSCLPLSSFFCVQIYANACLVQNVKKIVQYDLQKIVVRTKDGQGVVMSGEKLAIVKLCDGDLLISGTVKLVEVCNAITDKDISN